MFFNVKWRKICPSLDLTSKGSELDSWNEFSSLSLLLLVGEKIMDSNHWNHSVTNLKKALQKLWKIATCLQVQKLDPTNEECKNSNWNEWGFGVSWFFFLLVVVGKLMWEKDGTFLSITMTQEYSLLNHCFLFLLKTFEMIGCFIPMKISTHLIAPTSQRLVVC